MGGHPIKLTEEVEHVGILRSIHGNQAQIQSRFQAYRSQLYAILPVGLSRSHRGNPAASLNAHQTYCLPVLLSGIPPLILKKAEIKLIDQYLSDTLSNLQKLMPRTPTPVIHFLGGHLPAEALMHMRQLSILVWFAILGTQSFIKQRILSCQPLQVLAHRGL